MVLCQITFTISLCVEYKETFEPYVAQKLLKTLPQTRDPRGFAVKFYTEEGNWDLVGNNTPIFFVRDPILFPSFIHTQKRNPATHLKVRVLFQRTFLPFLRL